MITTTCTLKYPKGDAVTATINAETPYDVCTVVYDGALQRLQKEEPWPEVAATLAKLYFKKLADETGAELSMVTEGDYDAVE